MTSSARIKQHRRLEIVVPISLLRRGMSVRVCRGADAADNVADNALAMDRMTLIISSWHFLRSKTLYWTTR
jgi:hypothetical protein